MRDRLVTITAGVIAMLVVVVAVWLPLREVRVSDANRQDLAVIQSLATTNHGLEVRVGALTEQNRDLLLVLCTDLHVHCPANPATGGKP